MTMGVATANSILLVSFARQRRDEGAAPLAAALDAGATRIRPVLMTALAMIIGMIPMALGIGEGAEQNAPLGRAVIGGLLFATVSTLLFVPVVFAGVHERLARRQARARTRCDAAGCRTCRRPEPMTEPTTRSAVPHAGGSDAGDPTSAPPRRCAARTIVAAGRAACCSPSAPAARCCQPHGERSALEAGAAEHAGQYVQDHAAAKRGGSGQTAGAARHAAGLRAGADRGARQRLPEALDQGHRQPRREGRAAGRDRDARDRPAAVAGDRRARAGGGQPGAREEHGRALGGPAQEGRGLAAGARRAPQRRGAGAAPTSPRPTPTCSGCASSRASSAWWRRSPA